MEQIETLNSTYEIDEDKKLIRRLGYADGGTERTGDGEWREYAHKSILNGRLFIQWPSGTKLLPGSPMDAIPYTLTSPIIRQTEVRDDV